MIPPLHRLPLVLALLLCVAFAGSGCTKQARMERMMAAGDKALAKGDFKDAEQKYRTALVLVPENHRVLGRLGIMAYRQGRLLSAFYLLSGVREGSEDVEVHLYFGLVCLSLGRTAEARLAAKQVLEKLPTNEQALMMMVETCLTSRDNEESRRLVEKYREGGKDTAGHHVALGALALGRHEEAAAEAEFRKALEIDPKSANAYAYLAALAGFRQKPEEARQAWKQAADLAIMRSPIRIKYVDFLMKVGEYDEAYKQVVKILESGASDYVPAWVLKMKIAFVQEKYEESESAANDVLLRDRYNYDALLQKAAIKLVAGQTEKVIEDLLKIEATYDRVPQVKYQLALAYLRSGNTTRAEEYLLQALRLAPNYDEAVLMAAELQLQKGNPANAIGMLMRLLRTNFQVPRAYTLLSQAFRAQGDRNQALGVLRLLSAANPGSPNGPYLVGNLLLELGQPKEAREAFEEALRRSAQHWPSVEALVDMDLAGQQVDAASSRVEASVQKHPEAMAGRMLRAKLRLMAGNFAGAEEDLLKAIELDPKSQQPYLLLTRIYYGTDRAKEALEKLRVLSAQKQDVNVLTQMGMVQNALKQYDEARASYEQALTLDSNYVPALNNLAVLYSEHFGLVDKAVDTAKRAQSLQPNDPVLADTYSTILFRAGQYALGLRQAQLAAEKLPGEPQLQHRLGMFYYYLGQAGLARQNFQAALSKLGDEEFKKDVARRLAILDLDPASSDPAVRSHLERVLKEDPADPVALDRLAQIEVRSGQPREAAEHYEAVLKINAKSMPAMMALVDLYFGSLHKPERARDLVKLARVAEPSDPQIAWQLGRKLLNGGDFAAASTLLLEASRAINNQPELLFDLARSQYSLGRVAEAEKALESYLATASESPTKKQALRMATLLAAVKQPVLRPADIEAARMTIAETPTDIPAIMLLALDMERRGKYREAVHEYEEVQKLSPAFAAATRQLAILFAEHLGDDEKAEKLALKAKETLMEDAELDYQLGVINYRRGDYENAAKLLQQSARRRPDHAHTLFFLGLSHMHTRNGPEARKELHRALELKLPPQEQTEARRALERINRGG